jgi:hypothetical protein
LKKSQIFGFLAWVVEGGGWLTSEPEYYSFHNQRFLSEFDRAHPLSMHTPPKFNDISQNS